MKKKSERERNTGTKVGNGNKYLSIITLNVNGLYVPIKRHKVTERIRTDDQHISCLQATHLKKKKKKKTTQTESEGL